VQIKIDKNPSTICHNVIQYQTISNYLKYNEI
jgi:hypothetical protein